MNKGLVASFDSYELRLSTSNSISRTPNAQGVILLGVASTKYTKNTLDIADGILLVNETGNYPPPFGGDRWKYILDGAFGRFEYDGSGVKGSMSQKFILHGLKLYVLRGGRWQLKWQSAEWVVEGMVRQSFGNGEMLGELERRFVPSGIPVLGVPARLTASASLWAEPTEDPCGYSGSYCVSWDTRHPAVYDNSVDGVVSVNGGWLVNGAGLPCEVRPASLPGGGGCPFGLGVPNITATDTGDVSLTARAYLRNALEGAGTSQCSCPGGGMVDVSWYRKILQLENESSSVLVIPNLVRGVEKLRTLDEYGVLVARFGFPATIETKRRECCRAEWSECPCPPILVNEDIPQPVVVLPERPARVGVVAPSQSLIEDVFGEVIECPNDRSHRKWDVVTYLGIVPPLPCPNDPPGTMPSCCLPPGSEGHVWAEEVEFHYGSSDVMRSDMIPDFWHEVSGDARIVDTHLNPHYSFYLYFPPDSDGENWKVYGLKRSSREYWLKLRQQYGDLVGVARWVGDRPKQRFDIIGEPLLRNGHLDSIEEWLGAPMVFWGVSRFVLRDIEVPVAIELDNGSGEIFTFEDCTGEFTGLGVEVTPERSPCKVRFKVFSQNVKPFWFPLYADKLRLGAIMDEHVATRVVNKINAVGERKLWGSGLGVLELEKGVGGIWDDGKYAGSWVQDFILTSGIDVAPGGASGLVFNLLGERVTGVPLFKARALEEVEMVFEVSSLDPFLVPYPEWVRRDGDLTPVIFAETGQVVASLWGNKGMVRYGQVGFYDEAECALHVGVFYPPPFEMNFIDWVCFENLAEGRKFDTGLEDRVVEMWDGEEYQADTVGERICKSARDTRGFIWRVGSVPVSQARIILINSLREVPPLAQLPNRVRDRVTLEVVGAGYEQVVWSYGVKVKRYISPDRGFSLMDKAGLDITHPATTVVAPPGWVIREHDVALTNEEGRYEVVYDLGGTQERLYARAVPWHSYTGVFSGSEEGQVLLDSTKDELLGRHFVVYSPAPFTEVRVRRWDRFTFLDDIGVAEGVRIGGVACAFEGARALLLIAFEDEGVIKFAYNFAHGDPGRYSEVIPVLSGTHPSLAISRLRGFIFLAYHTGGDIRCRRWTSTAPLETYDDFLVVSGVPGGDIALEHLGGHEGSLACAFSDADGNIKIAHSFDQGATWVVG